MRVTVDGKPVEVPEGAMVSAAVARAGGVEFRRSVSGEGRGPLCGMGICFECRVTVDGRAHVRSCQTRCVPGMEIGTTGVRSWGPGAGSQGLGVGGWGLGGGNFEIVVVGAGPAGLAAARAAGESGKAVAVVDDNPAPGGQIWRGESPALPKAKIFSGARVIAAPEAGRLLLETSDARFDLGYRALILATGARERFLPFPGWTLPHVTGAGGLQALVKSGLPIAGKRVVVAGSGPLLLAAANYLREHGAPVPLVAEQAESGAVMRFGFGLARYPGKLAQAMRLRAGVRYLTGCWPVAAEPGAVTLRRGTRTWSERCDYLACGFGLVPNTELPRLLSCGTAVDEFQQTRTAGIYCAGEATGIGGLELSIAEGEIAGYAASGAEGRARRRFAERESYRRFAGAAEEAFTPRPELKKLPRDDTVVCRCEDVTFGRIRRFASWREAKLQTRCGMGACQGRVCGAVLEFLLGWKMESVRPPVFPARMGSLE